MVYVIETFRFKDENDYEYEICLKVFFHVFSKNTPEFFNALFLTRNVSTVIVIEGGLDLSRLQIAKTSNI